MRLKKVELSKLLFLLTVSTFAISCDFVEYHIIDKSRQELYPHNPSHPYREFMMHVWVPLQKKQCPLILFSHGLGKTYNGMTYTYLCQSIAAQGYVVASVSHTYGCKPIQFPDGRVADYHFPVCSSKHMFDIETEIWVADMVCALNECMQRNMHEGDMLYNKVDVSRVGIIGHSLGGSTALQVCRRDSRVAVAVNLDGPLYGIDSMSPIAKPMLFIFGSSVLPSQNTSLGRVPNHYQFFWRSYFNQGWLPSLNKFIASCSAYAHAITIDGIVHDTFTDYAFTPDPVIQPWLIDGAQAQIMIRDYVGDFLEKKLKNSQ